MTYIMSCVWLDYMIKYFQCKNCVGSSPKTKKCVASFLVPGYNSTRRPIGPAGAVFLLRFRQLHTGEDMLTSPALLFR